MSCNFTEKVSQWIDGELAADEAEQIELHVSTCAICQRAQEDFLCLRAQISAYPVARTHAAERRALAGILGTERVPLWRRKVALPAPALALIVLLIVVLGAWLIVTATTKPLLPAAIRSANPAMKKPSEPTAKDSLDLARFDRGERAVIYTAPRAPTSNAQP